MENPFETWIGWHEFADCPSVPGCGLHNTADSVEVPGNWRLGPGASWRLSVTSSVVENSCLGGLPPNRNLSRM